jgi:uncharacterized protein involved in type VI secretion and phage assembly
VSAKKYYGKYRGNVVQNVDPLQQGRIQVSVPAVSPGATWAMPCVPLAGPQLGTVFLPPIGAGVWVEYEAGISDHPIWTGGFWGPGELPSAAAVGAPQNPSVVLQSAAQHSLSISDAPGPDGGILLRSSTGAMIQINDLGIVISNGTSATIVLSGPTVNINAGALEIT